MKFKNSKKNSVLDISYLRCLFAIHIRVLSKLLGRALVRTGGRNVQVITAVGQDETPSGIYSLCRFGRS